MIESMPAIDPRPNLHWTVRSNYRLRTVSFAIMFVSIVLHGWGQGYGVLVWGFITLQLLVYPHLMYWRARRSAHPQQAEVDNLAVDSLLFGFLAASLGFPLWIAFTVYIASTLNITISRGSKGTLWSQLLFCSGVLISLAIFGLRLSLATAWPATIICLLGNAYYMISIGVAAFARNQQLREMHETLRLNEKTLKRQISEIQALQFKLQTEMEARVEQRTKEQVRSQKLASLGALVVGIAHEMNTPIGNAMLAASMLDDELRRLGAPSADAGVDATRRRTQDATKMIMSSLERTADLIRSFKRVAVIRAAQQRRTFALANLVGDLVATHSAVTHHARIEFKVEIPPDISLDSYPESLSQFLDILIDNARVHGFDGRSDGTMKFSAEITPAARLRLQVADNGKGIATANLPKIFDPFFTTRLGHGGNGLGLSVGWNIVTGVLGGTLEVVSEVGVGTTFFLDMPTVAPVADE